MAMFTMKKLFGFLMLFVFKTIMTMKILPTNEVAKNRQ